MAGQSVSRLAGLGAFPKHRQNSVKTSRFSVAAKESVGRTWTRTSVSTECCTACPPAGLHDSSSTRTPVLGRMTGNRLIGPLQVREQNACIQVYHCHQATVSPRRPTEPRHQGVPRLPDSRSTPSPAPQPSIPPASTQWNAADQTTHTTPAANSWRKPRSEAARNASRSSSLHESDQSILRSGTVAARRSINPDNSLAVSSGNLQKAASRLASWGSVGCGKPDSTSGDSAHPIIPRAYGNAGLANRTRSCTVSNVVTSGCKSPRPKFGSFTISVK